MSIELELKFLLAKPAAENLPLLLTACGNLQNAGQAALLNAYFDTSDNWFRQHDMGLRTRQKHGNFEQTIKLAGQQHGALQARPEFNVPVQGITPELAAFPPEIWPDNTDIDRLQQQIAEIFRTDFVRQSWQLHYEDSVLEVVYDSGEVIAGSKNEPISELELELLSGPASALFKVAAQLLSALPVRTGWLSKAARGYLLANKQQLTPPLPQQSGLVALLSALQCTEALYFRQQAGAASLAGGITELTRARHYLQQLSEELDALQYPALSSHAADLAEQLQRGVVIFSQTGYNQFLLELAQLLFQQSDAGQS
tara:strand:+ start:6590 stop:7525 length:936 start_codon:yes stop_codon:yes gene_type:complete